MYTDHAEEVFHLQGGKLQSEGRNWFRLISIGLSWFQMLQESITLKAKFFVHPDGAVCARGEMGE